MYRLRIPPINKLLNELASHITTEYLHQMKFLLSDCIPAGEMEECKNARDVFTKLKHMCLIGEHNLQELEEIFSQMRLMHLKKKVQEFREMITNDGDIHNIPQEQISRLPAPRHILVSLLLDQDYTQFNTQVLSGIQQAISEALGIQLQQVGYLLARPFNSYYVIFQLPESSAHSLTQAANAQQYWLYNHLQCIEVQINDSEPIILRQNQNDLIQPESIQVDEVEPRGDDLETDGGLQAPLPCHYQAPNTFPVIFTFHGNKLENEVTLDYLSGFKLNLCAHLHCGSNKEVLYFGFEGGSNNYQLIFLFSKHCFEVLNQCCLDKMRNWLRGMNVFEIHSVDKSSGTMNVIYRCCN